VTDLARARGKWDLVDFDVDAQSNLPATRIDSTDHPSGHCLATARPFVAESECV